MSDCRFGISPVNYPDPVPLHLGKDKYFSHHILENIHIIGKKAIFGLGMPPVTGGKTGQIKSL